MRIATQRSRRQDIDHLWSQVCKAYAQQGNWRAGEDKAFSKALADFEREFAPENLEKDVIVDFRQRRER